LIRFINEYVIFWTFRIAIVILVVMAVMGYSNTSSLIESTEWVSHTHRVISTLEEFLISVQDMEGFVRNYVITNEFNEKSYKETVDLSTNNLEHLLDITKDSPKQQDRIFILQKQFNDKKAFSDKVVQTRQESGLKPAFELIKYNRDMAVNKNIELIVSYMKDDEIKLLESRYKVYQKNANLALISIPLLAIVDGIIISIGYFFLTHARKQPLS
jgi:CHASE3 domain sensor protein